MYQPLHQEQLETVDVEERLSNFCPGRVVAKPRVEALEQRRVADQGNN